MAQPPASHAGLAFVSPLPQEVTLRHFELWRESVAEERPVVELEASPSNPGEATSYSLTVIGRERKGLLAALTEFLTGVGLETVSARIFTLPNESIMDIFQLRDPNSVLLDNALTSHVCDSLTNLVGEAPPSSTSSPSSRPMSTPPGLGTPGQGTPALGTPSAPHPPTNSVLSSMRRASIAPVESPSVEDLARRAAAGGSSSDGSSRLRRCSSNIAMFDLDTTLQESRDQAALHSLPPGDPTGGAGQTNGGASTTRGISVTRRQSVSTVYPPGYPPVDLAPLVKGEFLVYYSSKSLNRYRFHFRLSEDHQFLYWEGRSLRLSACVGVLFGPKSSTFRSVDAVQARVDQDWLCFSLVTFPRADNEQNPTTVDLVCETDDQLTAWLFALQRLCGSGSKSPYSYEAILRLRFLYKITTHAHDRGLTTRQYFLKKVRKQAHRVGRDNELTARDGEVAQLESDCDRLRKLLRNANARETVLVTKLHSLQADWDINFAELELKTVIGRGAYSEMWRGTWRGCDVAVKVLKAAEMAMSSGAIDEQDQSMSNDEHRHLRDFHDEVVLLSKLRHPNVVLFMAACPDPPNLCIVTEFCHGGNLFSAIRRPDWRSRMGHKEMISIARDSARGMRYLHSCRILHRDLKPQNLLLDRPLEKGCPVIVIADLGLSRDFLGGPDFSTPGESIVGAMTSETGTYRYMAPQVIRHEPYNSKADVYSWGITLWECFACELPFHGMTPIQAAFAVADKGRRPSAVSEESRKHPIPKAWAGLIEHCWHDDPRSRPRFDDILRVLDEMEQHGAHIIPPHLAALRRQAPSRRAGSASGPHSVMDPGSVTLSPDAAADPGAPSRSNSADSSGMTHSGSAPQLTRLA